MRQIFGGPEQAHVRVEVLSAFLDNQVAPAERARVENHLRVCAACRSELESLRRTVALLHALPRAAVPHAFTLSEASAGMRRAESSAWLGGLVRGLGAVTAVALVAVAVTAVLRQPAARPSETVARSAPTVAMVEKAVGQPVPPAAEAPVSAPAEKQPEVMAATEAGAAAPTEMAQPGADLAPAPESAPAARSVASTSAPEPATIAMAPSAVEATPAPPSAKAFGLGAGGAGADAALPAELLLPEPTPPIVAVTEVLPTAARLVYADLQALWAIDGLSGVRQLAEGETLNMPLISPAGKYVVYRMLQEGYVEVWGVPWDGGAPELLLNERELPREGLGAAYVERRVQDVRWVPGRLALALNISRVPSPDAPEAQSVTELWELEVTTGVLRNLAPLGSAYRPLYAPDGSQFALLEYGTEADPQGSLVLLDAKGGNQRLAVSFSASPAKQSYDSQVAWLPDSSALWLAIPVADLSAAAQFNGTTLYRVTAAGQAREAGFVDAYQVAWSPDGKRLAFLRITSESMEDGEIYLANADGTGAQRYAVVKNGAFVAWAPDSAHFLYQDNYQTFLGAVGLAPQRLGTSVSFVSPRWVTATQFVSLHDTGSGWLLTLRSIDGTAYGLTPLPREAMLDVTQP